MLIDIHVHAAARIGPFRANGETYATAEQLIAMHDERGIARGVILPGGSPECSHCPLSMNECLAIVAAYPGRVKEESELVRRGMMHLAKKHNMTAEQWEQAGEGLVDSGILGNT